MEQSQTKPFVTAMIVARNEESYIKRAVASFLNQHYPKESLEILIIDGNSEGDAPYRKVTDPQQVRPGDLIHYPTHWFIATKNAYSSPYFEVPCTQEVGGGSAGSIGWDTIDRPIDFSDTEVYTRYPLLSETE